MYPLWIARPRTVIRAAIVLTAAIIVAVWAWNHRRSSEVAVPALSLTSDPAVYERFSGSGRFIASPDCLTPCGLSSVGRDAGGRFGTLISDRLILSCAHAPPSGAIDFFPSDDPASLPQRRTIVHGEAWPDGDLWVGLLDKPLPMLSYPPFRISSAPSAFSWSTYLGRGACLSKSLLVGRGVSHPMGFPHAGMRAALGCLILDAAVLRNQPTATLTGFVPYGTTGRIGAIGGKDLFHSVPGDSGGPVMVPSSEGRWMLAGVISAHGSCRSDLDAGVESVTHVTCINQSFLDWASARFPADWPVWSTQLSSLPALSADLSR